jgi:hypothetical protein
MATFSGAVDGWAPTGAGPSGRARWRKESRSDMVGCGLPGVGGSGEAAGGCRSRELVGSVDIVREIWAGAVR